MADYWKSQARKYCDFCKCWISDNKPSVQFHENGKRHKASVAARLKEISKKSSADQKCKLQMEDDIRKMEEAAVKAYARDLEQHPDLSSQVVETTDVRETIWPKGLVEEKKTSWHEAKSPEGHVYYWHSVTGESRWEVPAEGFISMKDQSVKTAAAATPASKKGTPKSFKRKSGKSDGRKVSGKAKFDKSKKKTKLEAVAAAPVSSSVGSLQASNPYGTWETVVSDDGIPIDLQLPSSTTRTPLELCQPIVVEEEDEVDTQFTEKSATYVDDSNDGVVSPNRSIVFRKPKVNRNNKRQRSED